MTKLQLEVKIRDLEREIKYQGLDYGRLVKEKTTELSEALAVERFKVEEIEHRWNDSIQKQLSDLVKALTVKLPTLEIKELHTGSKEKQ